MKLEYIGDAFPDDPNDFLLRLYDFESSEVVKLVRVFRDLSEEPATVVQLDKMPFIRPIGGCQLLLKCRESDAGIVRVAGGDNRFECILKDASWELAANLAEPFAHNEANTFQWLYELSTPAEFLISHTGQW